MGPAAAERIEPDIWLITPRGELDLTTLPELEAVLSEMDKVGANILLDLSEVSFMDSSAAQLIVKTSKRLHEEGGHLSVLGPRPGPASFLRRTRLDRIIPVHATLDDALTRLGA